MTKFNSCIGAVVVFLASLAFGAVLNGWVFTILWGWFVVPTFHLPQLGIAAAIGIGLVVRFLTRQTIDVEPPERDAVEKWTRLIALETIPLWSLAMGWIVHLFMGMPS